MSPKKTSHKQVRKQKGALDSLNMPLDSLLGYQLRRASTSMREDLRVRYEALGFRIVESSVLLMIEANPGITQSQIGAELEIKSANMAPLVAFLEKDQHIERKRLDGRSQGLFLTGDGKSTAKQLWECVDANESWLLSRLGGVDSEELIQILESIWK